MAGDKAYFDKKTNGAKKVGAKVTDNDIVAIADWVQTNVVPRGESLGIKIELDAKQNNYTLKLEVTAGVIDPKYTQNMSEVDDRLSDFLRKNGFDAESNGDYIYRISKDKMEEANEIRKNSPTPGWG